MDKKRLILGLSVLLLIGGVWLSCFAQGGLFNRTQAFPIIGELPVETRWPKVGYVLLALGGFGLVLNYAMKSGEKNN